MCCRIGVRADGRDDVPALGGEPLDAELAETAGSARDDDGAGHACLLCRGDFLGHARIAGRRPNPQKLLVLARDPLIVVARDRKAAGYRWHPVPLARDQGPGPELRRTAPRRWCLSLATVRWQRSWCTIAT